MRRKHFNGAGELLVALSDDWVEFSELRQRLGWNLQTLYNRLRVLEEYGLVESKYEREPPGRRFIKLTEKGVKAKKALIEFYTILES